MKWTHDVGKPNIMTPFERATLRRACVGNNPFLSCREDGVLRSPKSTKNVLIQKSWNLTEKIWFSDKSCDFSKINTYFPNLRRNSSSKTIFKKIKLILFVIENVFMNIDFNVFVFCYFEDFSVCFWCNSKYTKSDVSNARFTPSG